MNEFLELDFNIANIKSPTIGIVPQAMANKLLKYK